MMWGQSDVTPAGKPAPGLHRLVARSFVCSDGNYLGVHTGAVGAFGRLMALLGLDGRIPSSADGLDLGVPLTDDQQHILETDLPQIFAPFRRLPQHRNKPGSGLGLYFVKTFVEEQGGRVWVESRVGEGTQFYIALPAEGPV